ncbi:hypothetical protein [Streptomyces sp. NPDC054863]
MRRQLPLPVVSSQGDNTFAVYDREFDSADGQDTPAARDGDGEEREATGFKFVDLGKLKDASDAL